MSHSPHHPEDRPPLDELNDTLRRAVESIRAEPLPADALSRAEARALRLALPSNGARRGLPKRFLALSGLAAALAIGVFFWPGGRENQTPEQELRVSKLEPGPEPKPVPNDPAAQLRKLDEADKSESEKEIQLKSAGDDSKALRERMLQTPTGRPQSGVQPGAGPARRDAESKDVRLESPTANPTPSSSPAPGMGMGGPAQGRGDAGGRGKKGLDAQLRRPDNPNSPEGRGGMSGGGRSKGMGSGGGGFGDNSPLPAMIPPAPASTAPAAPEITAKPTPQRFGGHPDKAAEEKGKEAEVITELLRKSKDLSTGVTPPDSGKGDKKPEPTDGKKADLKTEKQPLVWHRDRQRPTFARVYVGAGNSLELVSQQVTVTIEGPRARTLVDHIFHNPHDRQLEGTFEYPLPTGASAGYFAMFIGRAQGAAAPRFGRATEPLPADALARLTPAEVVKRAASEDWGNLQEARVVGKTAALETYEEIVRGRIDPALLEYAGGNTFSGRVFPIPARGYNRVLIAYEELLPYTEQGVQYRFSLPDCKLSELQFALTADSSDCREPLFVPKDAKKSEGGGRVSYTRAWSGQGPGGDVLFRFAPPNARVQATSGRQGESGPLYAYARIRPELDVAAAKPFASHAVFMLDTSLSEYPDRFGINMQLMRAILESDPAIKHFNVLTFDVDGRWLDQKQWIPNTPAGRDQAWKRLDGIVLEGATSMAAALQRLIPPDKVTGAFNLEEQTAVNVFVLSDGQITWGDNDVTGLVARFEGQCRVPLRFHCYRLGVGADNQELFEALTRRGGGIFQCYSEAELAAAAGAHRHHCFQIDRVSLVGSESSDLVIAGRKAAVYPGGELIVAARFKEPAKAELILEGTFLGKSLTKRYALDVRGGGELAARGWAEIAVASLLSLNDPKLESLVTAYCQQFGIGSKVASFLVLENPDDYKRLNLEAERGKTVPGGDLGRFLDTMWTSIGKLVSPKESFERFVSKVTERTHLFDGPNGAHVRKLISVLGDADFTVVPPPLYETILRAQDVPPAYLDARLRDRRDAQTYLAEARRRNDRGDVGGAVRALSTIVEEYPARADALRLVGYRLMAMNQAAQAVHLFQEVQKQRPFEPHSYRDLARSLEAAGNYGWSAVQYEIVLAGAWHNRFRDSLKSVALEEYVGMMRQAIQMQAVRGSLLDQFGERLEQLAGVKTQSDLRVTITWNSDATDVDLWVIEPDGTKCYYQNTRTKSGGELSQDQTQGYGPERYQLAQAPAGEYTIIVHYYRANPNLLAGETHVNVAVTRSAGTPREKTEKYNVILRKADEQAEVCRIKVGRE